MLPNMVNTSEYLNSCYNNPFIKIIQSEQTMVSGINLKQKEDKS